MSNDIAGNSGFGIGDVILKFSHLPVLTQKYAILLTLEASFDTADKAEHGLGSNVLRPGVTYARFLPGGSLFAPTVQHAFSVGDVDPGRTKVNNTAFDLYYVPRLKDPRSYMTIDPAVLYHWERDKLGASLAVTLGRVIPTALPGTSSVFIKPSIGIRGCHARDSCCSSPCNRETAREASPVSLTCLAFHVGRRDALALGQCGNGGELP